MKLIVAIIGPTASGKTSFAIDLATQVGGEVICVDSTTIYRGFDIGTSKPTKEEQAKVPHHLIDVLSPEEPFSAGSFVAMAERAIADCEARGKLPILVGGTYFYLRALQQGMYELPEIPTEAIEAVEKQFYDDDVLNTTKMHAALSAIDPKSAAAIHPNDRYRLVRALAIIQVTKQLPSELKAVPRPEQSNRYWLKYAIGMSRHTLNQAIQKRVDQMLAQGLIEETRGLLEKYPTAKALGSIGYSESVAVLQKRLTEKQIRNEIIEKTRQLAKRQMTWLRSDHEVRYVDFRDVERVKLEIANLTYLFGRETACAQ